MEPSRVTIFTGGYGSGKTEIAVNYALKLADTGKKVAIVDLDIVNPYFRSREAEQIFAQANVLLVAPRGRLRTADLPALPPEIISVLRDPDMYVVLDVGGDDIGATALGRFKSHIPKDFSMFLVVNPARPFQSTAEKILGLATKISRAARLPISGLVCNANLRDETTKAFIEEGYKIVESAADLLGVDVVFTTVTKQVREKEGAPRVGSPLFTIHLYMLPPWQK